MLDNNIFSFTQFKSLAEIRSPHCISIYMPTHRKGEEVKSGKDRLVLKNTLQNIRKELKSYNLSDNEIESILKPAYQLLAEDSFWRQLSDGLAIFMKEGFFEFYVLPIYFDSFHFISGNFYLKPLVPMFNGNGRFYLLALSLDGASLFEGTKHSIAEIEISDIVPDAITQSFHEEDKEKSLQFRTGQQGDGNAQFHGHHSKDEKNKDIFKHFRAIDQGLKEVLSNDKSPLIVACVDFLFPLYKEANTYKYLYNDYIKGNPEGTDIFLLHEKAWLKLEPHFEHYKKQIIENFNDMVPEKETIAEIEKVIPAAINGRIENLLIKNMSSLPGLYNLKTGKVEVHSKWSHENNCLLDLAAKETLLKGGNVFLVDQQDMPVKTAFVNATLRF